ncbi:MAG: hypothetical protein JRE64_28700, partial [Deltaproteobacteria bacterium]|nr:hypothetical protein [Deltaproteobacteria bacterium]
MERLGRNTTTALDTVNGNKFVFTDVGSATTANDTPDISFTFSSAPVDLTADTYTMTTTNGIQLVGTSTSDVFTGTLASDGFSLSFDTIGVTLTSATTLTAAAFGANSGGSAAGDTIVVSDTGYSAMTVASSTTTGTWTIDTDTTNAVILTNSNDATQTQTLYSAEDTAQTLDFDQLGITLTLNSDYDHEELNDLTFDVGNSGSSTFQVGASNTANNRIEISLGDTTTAGLLISDISLANASGAQSALDTIDAAINSLATIRGNVGAAQNRLSYAAANL